MDGFIESLAPESRRRTGLGRLQVAFLMAVGIRLMHREDGSKGKREGRMEEGRVLLLNNVRPGPRSQLVYGSCRYACEKEPLSHQGVGISPRDLSSLFFCSCVGDGGRFSPHQETLWELVYPR